MESHWDGYLLFDNILSRLIPTALHSGWVQLHMYYKQRTLHANNAPIGCQYGWHLVDLRLCQTGRLIVCALVTRFVSFSKEIYKWLSGEVVKERLRWWDSTYFNWFFGSSTFCFSLTKWNRKFLIKKRYLKGAGENGKVLVSINHQSSK